MNWKVCIIEDEKSIARYIQESCETYFSKAIIKHICSKYEAEDWLAGNEVDLVLLDLNINGEDGFDLLKLFSTQRFHTIVISAYRERAIEAYEYGVLDFVGKPFSIERLHKAFHRFTNSIKSTHTMRQLTIKKHNGLHFIPTEDIVYLKGAGNYSEIYTEDSRPELHSKSLDRLSQLLPNQFFRIHKSYIVQLEMIQRIESSAGSKYGVILKDGTSLPVGRTRIDALKKELTGNE